MHCFPMTLASRYNTTCCSKPKGPTATAAATAAATDGISSSISSSISNSSSGYRRRRSGPARGRHRALPHTCSRQARPRALRGVALPHVIQGPSNRGQRHCSRRKHCSRRSRLCSTAGAGAALGTRRTLIFSSREPGLASNPRSPMAMPRWWWRLVVMRGERRTYGT